MKTRILCAAAWLASALLSGQEDLPRGAVSQPVALMEGKPVE